MMEASKTGSEEAGSEEAGCGDGDGVREGEREREQAAGGVLADFTSSEFIAW